MVSEQSDRLMRAHGRMRSTVYRDRLLEEVKEIFETFDSNKDGLISLDEFKQNLKRTKFFVPADKIDQMFNRLDENSDGFLVPEEFYRYAVNQQDKILKLR